MESFAIELVSNASAQLFPDNTLSSFTNFLTEQLNLEGQLEVAISEISYPSMYQNVTEGNFFDKTLSNYSQFYYLEPGLYPSITDIVEAVNTLIQERHNHNGNCITVKVSRRTRKVVIYLANERSGLAFFSMDLGHILWSIVGNEFGVKLRKKMTSQARTCLWHFPHTLSPDIHGPDWVQYRWRHKGSIAALLSCYFEAQIWRHYNHWTVHELSDI